MRVIYSKLARRVHRYDDGRAKEQCNVDAILDEDRVVEARMVEDPQEIKVWVESRRLRLCKRCFP